MTEYINYGIIFSNMKIVIIHLQTGILTETQTNKLFQKLINEL